MRSVFIFVVDVPREDVVRFLDNNARRSEVGWQVGAPDAPYLFITLDQNGFTDFEPEDLESIVGALGRKPELLLMIDVSGRIDGYHDALSYTLLVLERFDGVVQDDHWTRIWTKSDLIADRDSGAETFFRGPNRQNE